MDEFHKIMQAVFQQQQNILKYEIAEGFAVRLPDGKLTHSTPEMLGVDIDNIFNGLEDVVTGINALFGYQPSK